MILAMAVFTLTAQATEYWVAFRENAPTIEVKSFDSPDGEWTELSRDTREGRVIIMEVTAAEYAAGFGALSNPRKLEGLEAANAEAADFGSWTETEMATAKVFADKHEAMKEILTAMMTHDAALRAIVLANTQYDTVAKLKAILDPMGYADYKDEIEAKMHE